MDEAKAYYKIVTEIWKTFRRHLDTVSGITDWRDEKWKAIVDDFEHIEKSSPESLKRYVGDMILLHVDELERRWRK